MKRLAIFFLFFSINSGYAQSVMPLVLEGVYKGPLNYENGYSNGYFIFKNNFTFIYLELQDKDSLSIKKIGNGKWYYKNNKLSLNFLEVENKGNLTKHVKYTASTQLPFDSVYVRINVMNENNEPLGFTSVHLVGTNNGGVTDSLGNYSGTFSLQNNFNLISISKVGYHKKELSLIQQYNCHDFRIRLNPEINFELELIKASKPFNFKFLKVKDKRLLFEGGFTLKKEEMGFEKIRRLLEAGIRKEPGNQLLLSAMLQNLSK